MSDPAFVPSVCEADRLRIEWCITTLRSIADQLKCEQGPGMHEMYVESVQVIGTLKRVLQPNIVE